MMKNLLKQALLLCLLLLSAAASAQDVIVKKSGEEVIGKIIRVDQDTVHYKYFSDPNGVTLFVLRRDVAQLRMATAVELPAAPQPAEQVVTASVTPAAPANNTAEMMMRGRQDAYIYYKGKGIFWGTAGATGLYPLAGLVGGGGAAAFPPDVYESNPNYDLLKDPTYAEAYRKQAHKRKVGKAAAGFGTGLGALVVIYMVIIASMAGA